MDTPTVGLGGDGTYHSGGYLDEIRISTSTFDKPQMDTYTDGVKGNKSEYDVHGWRSQGHEFTDDNATSLLIHGDSQRDDVVVINGIILNYGRTFSYGHYLESLITSYENNNWMTE